MIIKKCMKCKAEVLVHHDCTCENCGIRCCGEQMEELVPEISNGEIETEIKDDKLVVSAKGAEWICIEHGKNQKFTYDEIAKCCHSEGVKVYAYFGDKFVMKEI